MITKHRHLGHHSPMLQGSKNKHAKLVESDVLFIRAHHAEHPGAETVMMLAAKYGCTTHNITKILRRDSWRHV